MCKRCQVFLGLTLVILLGLILSLLTPMASNAATDGRDPSAAEARPQLQATPVRTPTPVVTPPPGDGTDKFIICVGSACADGAGAGAIMAALVLAGAAAGYYACRRSSPPGDPTDGRGRPRPG